MHQTAFVNRCWPALALVLSFGCSQESRVAIEEERPASVDTRFERLPAIVAVIQQSSDPLLYEGLPSRFWDPQLREQEIKSKPTTKLHGYLFYEEALSLSAGDAAQLRTLFSARDSFRRFRDRKSCGSSDPEYCVQWKKGEQVTQVVISLECGEVRMFGPQSELLCDLSPEMKQKLKQLLSNYRKNNSAAPPGT